MTWTFERRFYGKPRGLDMESVGAYLMLGRYPLPRTLLEGRYKAVVRTAEHDAIYAEIERPFPDALLAQRPAEPFALHLSGGFDSSILAKLYDRPDVAFVHLRGPESAKARALADTLEGTLHEIEVTPESFIEAAEELLPRLPEPYVYEDIVYAYLANQKARELGYALVVAGDGADLLLGGSGGDLALKMRHEDSAIIWKTAGPAALLGLRTLLPFAHASLYPWAMACLAPADRDVHKRFAARFCRQLGLPAVVCEQKKAYWAGAHGTRTDPRVLQHMQAVVAASDYRCLRDLRFPQEPRVDLPFRLFSLVRWLQANYQERLTPSQVRDLEAAVARLDLTHLRERTVLGRLRLLIQARALEAARGLLRPVG